MLTTGQLTTLKADIIADPGLSAFPNEPDGNAAIAAIYNVVVAPDYWVWRTRVEKSEYTQSTSIDSTVFNWTGAGFIVRSVGERDAWREIFNASGSCNPSLPNVRQAFQDIFSGATAPAPANRTHLATVSRRKATRVEKLFATGAGTTGAPSLLTVELPLVYQDVDAARNMP